MFDADNMLITSVTLTTSTDTAPTSTTRDGTSYAAVIDIGNTGKNGLTAALVLTSMETGAEARTLTGYLEACASVDFSSAVEYLGKFGVANATSGVILGVEVPCVATIRFVTEKQYVRANITVNGDFATVQCGLLPDVIKTL
jgi:hypothetical protein